MMTKDAYIAANRFGLGASASEMKIIDRAPKDWLRKQVSQSTLSSELSNISSGLKSTVDIITASGDLRNLDNDAKKKLVKQSRDIYLQEMQNRVTNAVVTDAPFVERLALFWSNHFTVSIRGKPFLTSIAGSYEREAIRPHIFGKFSDMLLAVVQHPSMLTYLDNKSSVGPTSKLGQRRDKGLNENLAREILELHTLGVNGGYTQDDVISLAKIITGWTIKPPKMPGEAGFWYFSRMHEPGAHRLLGKSYSEKGQKQGIEALTDLAHHPSTARFIATKLVRHFVSDDPPAQAVKAIERVFIQSGGDLKAVSLALIELPQIWQRPLTKFKTPYEFVISSLRLFDAGNNDVDLDKIIKSLTLLDHAPYTALSPAGWDDSEDAWLSPNALMNRVEWCHAVAQSVAYPGNPLELAQNTIGPVANADTLLWISRAPSGRDGVGLLLASPAFQRR